MAEITIIGTGAMALYFGSRLAAAGERVRFLGSWQEGIDAINRKGICVVNDAGKNYYPAQASVDPGKFPATQLAMVLVKSWQTERAASLLTEVLHQDGIVLTLQNGLGNAEILTAALGEDQVAQGVTTYGATVLGPGIVRPGGEGVISVQQHPRLASLVQILRKCDLEVQEVADITSILWSKLVINVAINPLTGILSVKNGNLLDNPAAKKIMGMSAREAAEVASGLGIKLNFKDPVRQAERVAAATAENLSSMLQDIQRNAPTEIDSLCGSVVRSGRMVDLPTPVNEILMLLIQAKKDFIRKANDDNRENDL